MMADFDVGKYYDFFVVIGFFIVFGFWLVLRLLKNILDHFYNFIVYYVYFENEKLKNKKEGIK